MALSTGPIPDRSETRSRHNKPEIPIDKVTAIGAVQIPELGIPNAHQMVVDLYESMKNSAQKQYYEPSDWQTARLAMFVLNDYIKEENAAGERKPISAMKLTAINQMLTTLLLTEGDRRRVRIEVERNQTAGEVIDIATVIRDRMKNK